MRRTSLRATIAVALTSAAGALVCAPAWAAGDTVSGRYIVVLRDAVASPAATSAEQARRYGVRPAAVFASALKGYAAAIPADKLAAVRADPAVQFIAPERRFHIDRGVRSPSCATVAPTGPGQCLPTGVDRINGDRSSTRAGDGRAAAVNENVAVIDTGISPRHPDLNVAGGVDCSTGTPVDDPAHWGDQDTDGHGTFVAGIIGAKDNGIGVVGAAPGARLWAVATGVEITDASVLCSINWVTSTRRDSDPRNDIAVANMSLGANIGMPADDRCGLTDHDPVHVAICKSVAAGVAYVASAGNDATDLGNQIPASYREVLAVTAMADFDGRPGGVAAPICHGEDYGAELGIRDDVAAQVFSNFATRPSDAVHTIAAPGVCIDSTFPPDSYFFGSGTSFSAPHAAGTVALCLHTGACRGQTGRQIIDRVLLRTAAANLAAPAYGYIGDPLRPLAGRYYGFLVAEGVY
jgi:hypothetical protein